MCDRPVQLGYEVINATFTTTATTARLIQEKVIPKHITLTMACLAIIFNIAATAFSLRPRKRWIMADVFFFNLFLTSVLWAISYIVNVFMYFHDLEHHTMWTKRLLTINRVLRGTLEVSFILEIVIMAISRLLAVQCPYIFRNYANRKMGCRVVTYMWVMVIITSTVLTVVHAFHPEGIQTQILFHLHSVYAVAILLCLIYSYVVYKVISQNDVGGVARRKSQRKWVLYYSMLLSVTFTISFVPRSIDQLWNCQRLGTIALDLLPMVCSCFQAIVFVSREVCQMKEESRKKTLTFSRSSSHQWEGQLKVTVIQNRQMFDTKF